MENQAWEMKGPSEKHLCSLEIELGSLSPSHLPTAFQGQGAFLGVNERFLRIPLLSEATFEGARGPDKLCLPAQYMYVPGPRKKRHTSPSHCSSPPSQSPPLPTPSRRPCELPKGWGEGTSLATELLSVFPQALWSSDQSAPVLSSGASLPPQPSVPCKSKGSIGAALARSAETYSLSTQRRCWVC